MKALCKFQWGDVDNRKNAAHVKKAEKWERHLLISVCISIDFRVSNLYQFRRFRPAKIGFYETFASNGIAPEILVRECPTFQRTTILSYFLCLRIISSRTLRLNVLRLETIGSTLLYLEAHKFDSILPQL